MTISRRNFIKGLIAAPAIVAVENIMPIWVPPLPDYFGSSMDISEDGLVLAIRQPTGSNQGGLYLYDWEASQWKEREWVDTTVNMS